MTNLINCKKSIFIYLVGEFGTHWLLQHHPRRRAPSSWLDSVCWGWPTGNPWGSHGLWGGSCPLWCCSHVLYSLGDSALPHRLRVQSPPGPPWCCPAAPARCVWSLSLADRSWIDLRCRSPLVVPGTPGVGWPLHRTGPDRALDVMVGRVKSSPWGKQSHRVRSLYTCIYF